MTLRSLFTLLGRMVLALMLVANPCVRPMLAGATPANDCCGSPLRPAAHACCCDGAAALPGVPGFQSVCCERGELPPFVPAPVQHLKQQVERIDLVVVEWRITPLWWLAANSRVGAVSSRATTLPAIGPRRHLRNHILLI